MSHFETKQSRFRAHPKRRLAIVVLSSFCAATTILLWQNFSNIEKPDQILAANPALHTIVWRQPIVADNTIANYINYAGNPKNPIYNSSMFWLDATLMPGYTLQNALAKPVSTTVGDFTKFYPKIPIESQMGNGAQYGSVAVQAEGNTIGVLLSPQTFGCCDPKNSYPSANLSFMSAFSPAIQPWSVSDSSKVRFAGNIQVPNADLQGGAKITFFMELWFNEQPELPAGSSYCRNQGISGPCCIGLKGQCETVQMVSEIFNLNQPQTSTYFGGDPKLGPNEIVQVRQNPNQPFMTQLTGSSSFSPNTFTYRPFAFEISAQQLVQARLAHAQTFGVSPTSIELSGHYYVMSLAQLAMEIQWLAPNPFAWGAYSAQGLEVSYSNPLKPSQQGLNQVNIAAAHTGYCVDLPSSKADNGTELQQWQCLGPQQANQSWNLVPAGNGNFEIVSSLTGKCLDVTGVSKNDGALIQEWQCSGTSNQVWTLKPVGGSDYQIVSVNSGKCLDVAGASSSNGAKLQQWDCLGASQRNQIFDFFDP